MKRCYLFDIDGTLITSGGAGVTSFNEAVKEGDALRFLTIIGINAEKWIGIAFDTRGFGSWAPNAAAKASPRTSPVGFTLEKLRRSMRLRNLSASI